MKRAVAPVYGDNHSTAVRLSQEFNPWLLADASGATRSPDHLFTGSWSILARFHHRYTARLAGLN